MGKKKRNPATSQQATSSAQTLPNPAVTEPPLTHVTSTTTPLLGNDEPVLSEVNNRILAGVFTKKNSLLYQYKTLSNVWLQLLQSNNIFILEP